MRSAHDWRFALVNSQSNELKKFVQFGYPDKQPAVRFAAYTGQERDERRDEILNLSLIHIWVTPCSTSNKWTAVS